MGYKTQSLTYQLLQLGPGYIHWQDPMWKTTLPQKVHLKTRLSWEADTHHAGS